MLPFTALKAGMGGVSKEMIQKVIDENTSVNFDVHAKKRKERVDARIERYNQMISKYTPHQITQAEAEIDALSDVIERERDLTHYAVHIDLDAFYAAVEMRDDPSLRTIPIAVGSESMLSTSNYVARRFGVRAAMPGFIAKKLCPELKIVRSNFEKYRAASFQVREVLKDYDPNFYMSSLDEAYMDLTAYTTKRIETGPVEHERFRYTGDCVCRLPLVQKDLVDSSAVVDTTEVKCGNCDKNRVTLCDRITFGTTIEEIVSEIRFRIEQVTGLTCSAGIAPNSMIAKVCSDVNKPDGQFRVVNDRSAVLSFIESLPIRKVGGIGPVTETVLKGIGIEKCGDLYLKRGILSLIFTQFNYEYFLRIALGISSIYTSDGDSRRKSISAERTFHPTSNLKSLLEIINQLCNELVDSMQDHHVKGGRTVTVKIKYSTFDVVTRCCSVDYVIGGSDRLICLCEKLIRHEIGAGNKELRLLGVRLSRLVFDDDKVEKSKPLSSFWKTRSFDLSASESSNNSNDQNLMLLSASNSSSNIDTTIKFNGTDEMLCNVHCNESECASFCPICGISLPEDGGEINTHIDICLNRDIIETERSQRTPPRKENVPKKEKLREKRSHKRHKELKKHSFTTLDNYFQKRRNVVTDIHD